jgi:hypothetical protein
MSRAIPLLPSGPSGPVIGRALLFTVLSESVETAFVFTRYFYWLCNAIIIVFHTSVFKCRSSLENVKSA